MTEISTLYSLLSPLLNMNLLRNIVQGVWMVDEATMLAAGPLVLKLMKGEKVEWYASELETKPYAYFPRGNARYGRFQDAPKGSVAVHPINGVITKFDQYCGPRGTESLMKAMQKADDSPNIIAHLLEIDSGGGEATNIETVAQFIRQLKKPVVAIVNGLAASAAYYMAAAADEIYASERTDIFGSIGVRFTFADAQPMWEEKGVKFHDIFASQSTLKGKDFQKAREGEYDALRSNLLDPYADQFIETMQAMRPQIKDDGKVFKGQIYPAPKAQALGLIDGIRTWEATLERAVQLGHRAQSLGSRPAALNRTTKPSNTMKMDLTKINAVLGYQVVADENGGVYLQPQELGKLTAAISAAEPSEGEISALEAINASLSDLGDTLEANALTLANIQAEQGKQSDRIEALENVTAGDPAPATPKAEQDPANAEEEPLSPEEETYRQAALEHAEMAKNWNNPYA